MSAYENEFDDDLDMEDTGNDAMRQLRKANRAKEKELAELKAQLQELNNDRRNRTIKDVFSSRGVNEKIASFVPKDIDLNEESLSTWLDENADVFGIRPNSPSAQPNVPEGYQQQYARQQAAMDSSMTLDRERAIQAQMEEAAAKGPESLKAFFKEMSAQGL